MFIPGAGFISAILSIYDTVMVFVNKITQDHPGRHRLHRLHRRHRRRRRSAPAATRVESALAGLLSLAINFLAGFAGLGKVADKVMGVIKKIRAPIDKALGLAGQLDRHHGEEDRQGTQSRHRGCSP